MSGMNSALNKVKSANNRFQLQARTAINDLKRIERQAKSYQSKLRSSSTPLMSSVSLLYLGSAEYDINDYLYTNEDVIKEYDVFISYATEDKDEVARPLATALRGNGLKVWYDEFELRIGHSLRRKIDKGIANSNFGVIAISRDFIKKDGQTTNLTGWLRGRSAESNNSSLFGIT